MTIGRRTSTVSIRLRLASVAALATVGGALGGLALALLSSSAPARAASIGELSSQLDHERGRQQSLSASIGRLSGLIGSLDSQITLVQSREAAVRAALVKDRAALAKDQLMLTRERQLVTKLIAQLARARTILAQQLVSSYEGSSPDIVSVVLESQGFSALLDQLNYLNHAEQEQKSTIMATKLAKAEADNAERRLAKLEAAAIQVTEAATTRERALVGMNTLLQAKQAALGRAREAQQSALAASRARGAQLQSAIGRLQAQQAAAERAAAAAATVTPTAGGGSATPVATGPTLGASGGWAIPYAIVLCESGGQNLSPNSAGASGYYQILPSTWKLFGGTGPAAYLASKAEQDAVASRIWNGGAGASNWVCAGIVGIH
jgi:septal ring factor EnvC (AmiA/AmiB activator)